MHATNHIQLSPGEVHSSRRRLAYITCLLETPFPCISWVARFSSGRIIGTQSPARTPLHSGFSLFPHFCCISGSRWGKINTKLSSLRFWLSDLSDPSSEERSKFFSSSFFYSWCWSRINFPPRGLSMDNCQLMGSVLSEATRGLGDQLSSFLPGFQENYEAPLKVCL